MLENQFENNFFACGSAGVQFLDSNSWFLLKEDKTLKWNLYSGLINSFGNIFRSVNGTSGGNTSSSGFAPNLLQPRPAFQFSTAVILFTYLLSGQAF